MQRISLVQEAHKIISGKLLAGGIAIDATVGNGHDTVFLAKQAGIDGTVYGFDIQRSALDVTRSKLEETGMDEQVKLILASHESMLNHIPEHHTGRVNAIMFNLGYLPGGDKTVTTQKQSTLKAVSTACALLTPHGCITIIAYPGHEQGQEEKASLKEWSQSLNDDLYIKETMTIQGCLNKPPCLFIITRRY